MNTNLTLHEIAKMIDHSLLQPTLTDQELEIGCKVAATYQTASVCIKPYAVRNAIKWLKGTDIPVCTVIGFPHGSATIENKVAETIDACINGALEIDMVVNIGKVISEDWQYIQHEISEINNAAITHHAIVKVIFENDFLSDQHKIRLCKICSEIGVAFVKTSTGYGYFKGEDGKFTTKGATVADVRLMRENSDPKVQVKAAGGVRTLDELMIMREAGATRIGATATIAILEELKKRLGIESSNDFNVQDKSGY
ncbi:MAG: deoxyribose-phosphate aldolase [Chitinophagaceae bacterium]